MIQYIKKSGDSDNLVLSEELLPSSWIRVESPTELEIDDLLKQFDFDKTIIKDALDPHEIPRLETVKNIFYFITRIPDTDDEFNDFTTPIMFIIHPKHIVTLSRDSLNRLWQPFITKRTINTSDNIQTLVAMFEAILSEYHNKVMAINRQMRAASKDITQLKPNDISVFVEYERKLNDYLDALMPSSDALIDLLGGRYLKMNENDHDLTEDVSISFRQIIGRCKSLLRTITNVRDSYRAVMDTQLNETLKLLTIITLALTIPTMIAGLYGMNVELPGHENSPATFWIIAILSLGTSAIMAFYFLRKRR